MNLRRAKALTLALVLILILLPACGPAPAATALGETDKVMPDKVLTVEDLRKNFKLNLYTDKNDYKQNEQIKIWATLEYIGSNKQIKIWHGDPYVSFTITDGKEFNTGGIFEQILTSTTLDKGMLYTFNYVKTGGYEEKSPDADFWRKFYNQKELYLPKGNYTIRVQGAFSLDQYGNKITNNLIEERKIRVN